MLEMIPRSNVRLGLLDRIDVVWTERFRYIDAWACPAYRLQYILYTTAYSHYSLNQKRLIS